MADLRRGAKWIWCPNFKDHDDLVPGRFVLFRKTVNLDSVPLTVCILNISADTRYRLYVNGSSVAFGPCKSYLTRWYYETVDIQPFLKPGSNTVCVKVLRFFSNQAGSTSLTKSVLPGLIVWGEIGNTSLISDEEWRCTEDKSVMLRPRSEWNYLLGPPFLSLDEQVDFAKANLDWHNPSTDISAWDNAIDACPPVKMLPVLEPWKLHARPIPNLPEIEKTFSGVLKTTGPLPMETWSKLLQTGEVVHIDANQAVTVDLENSVLTTGFLELDCLGGSDAQISILYSEGYEEDLKIEHTPFPLPRRKGDRRDHQNGRLYGTEDRIVLAASDNICSRYEPFWFRAFRFVQLRIVTKCSGLTLQRIAYRETHYPLEITTKLDLDASSTRIWNICLNTLRNCMHETYEDCPFYEQNQFAMDGRLQLLFTYQLSRDDRLARKTIHEFHASRQDGGLLEPTFPASSRSINIPQFSLYWILMLYDHMMYFGDADFIRRYMGTADGILTYFDSCMNDEGLVGAFDPECWAFVDWVKEWQGTRGIRDMAVPTIYKRTGVALYNSLVYAWALNHAAALCDFMARKDTAAEYRNRAILLNSAARRSCFDGNFFTDGPGTTDISEHVQVFAILSGAVSGPDATALLRRTLSLAVDAIPRCSLAMKHYLFRALEQTGLYDEYFEYMMAPWHNMVAQNLTTCPENEFGFRSDCHGWSASPIYEYVAVVYGIQPRQPGFGGSNAFEPRQNILRKGYIRYVSKTGDVEMKWGGNRSVTEAEEMSKKVALGEH